MPTLSPAPLQLLFQRGSKVGPFTVTVQTAAGGIFALTGYSVFWTARPETESPNIYDLEPTITDAPNGVITVEFTDEEVLTNFPVGNYVHSLVLQNATGDRLPPTIEGPLIVEDQPTRV